MSKKSNQLKCQKSRTQLKKFHLHQESSLLRELMNFSRMVISSIRSIIKSQSSNYMNTQRRKQFHHLLERARRCLHLLQLALSMNHQDNSPKFLVINHNKSSRNHHHLPEDPKVEYHLHNPLIKPRFLHLLLINKHESHHHPGKGKFHHLHLITISRSKNTKNKHQANKWIKANSFTNSHMCNSISLLNHHLRWEEGCHLLRLNNSKSQSLTHHSRTREWMIHLFTTKDLKCTAWRKTCPLHHRWTDSNNIVTSKNRSQ